MDNHPFYNIFNFPHFLLKHGNWDIHFNDKGYCAAIANTQQCLSTHFGDYRHVEKILGICILL